MEKYKVVKSLRFIEDSVDIFVYIGSDNLDAADRFTVAVDDTLKFLSTIPKIGRVVSSEHDWLSDWRQYPVEKFRNYLIFYRIKNNTIYAERVFGGMRDILSVLGG